jgi:hypothetical protein
MPITDDLLSQGVTFYFPENEFSPASAHYVAAGLAEGLRAQRVPVYANIAHELFHPRDLTAFTGGLIVFVVTEKTYSPTLIAAIEQFAGRHKFILSMADVNSTMLTSAVVPSLMTHESRFLQFKNRRLPWAFGLTEARLAAAAAVAEPPFEQRSRVVLRNFRPSFRQGVRHALDLVLLPHLERHFQIDRSIAADNHFHRLTHSLGCLAYGGDFQVDFTRNPHFAAQPTHRDLARSLTIASEPAVCRWDSWRFWESLATGCLTFQLDLEKYGLLLPVAPKPWIEYIPVDFADPRGTVEHLMDLEPRWAEIAGAGKKWALDHYSPLPVADRFLALAGEFYP